MAGDRGTAAKPLHVPHGLECLPTGWSWGRLDDLCEGVFDCPHSTPKLVDAGPLVVRTQDIITGVFRTEQAAHVSEETFRERTVRALPRRGDLLYSREGTYFGIAAEVPEKVRVCLGQRMVLIRPLASKLDFRFLRHWLNSPVMAAHIHGHRDGSVAERLNLPTIRALPIAVPPLPEQRAIAHILGTMDDKIELNRRANDTLEAMARALFKAWFVDFEPVRAKLEGRWQRGQSLPGLPAHLYALFPDRLVESELEEIPEGWDVSTLGEVSAYLNRGISPKYVERDGVLVLNQKCIRNFSIDFTKARRHDAAQRKIDGRALELGDVLVNSTGVGTLGRVAPVLRLPEATIVDSHVTVVRSGSRINAAYLGGYMGMKQPEIEAMGEGSTGQTELSRTKLGSLKILLPTNEVLECFAKQTKPVSEMIVGSQQDSESLTQLRDTLLPRLISGELRVPDAEAFLRERGL